MNLSLVSPCSSTEKRDGERWKARQAAARGAVKHLVIYGALIWWRPIHCFAACGAAVRPADSNFPLVGEDGVSWANGILFSPHPSVEEELGVSVCEGLKMRVSVWNQVRRSWCWWSRKQTAVPIYSARCTWRCCCCIEMKRGGEVRAAAFGIDGSR